MTKPQRDIFDILAIVSMFVTSLFAYAILSLFLTGQYDEAKAEWVTAIATVIIGLASVFFLYRQSGIMKEQKRVSSISYYEKCYSNIMDAKLLALQTSYEYQDFKKVIVDQLLSFIKTKHYAELYMPEDIVALCDELHIYSIALYDSGSKIIGENDETKKQSEKNKFDDAKTKIHDTRIVDIFRRYTKV